MTEFTLALGESDGDGEADGDVDDDSDGLRVGSSSVITSPFNASFFNASSVATCGEADSVGSSEDVGSESDNTASSDGVGVGVLDVSTLDGVESIDGAHRIGTSSGISHGVAGAVFSGSFCSPVSALEVAVASGAVEKNDPAISTIDTNIATKRWGPNRALITCMIDPPFMVVTMHVHRPREKSVQAAHIWT
jgi:hypothetical protein